MIIQLNTYVCIYQGWDQVQLIKYSNISVTENKLKYTGTVSMRIDISNTGASI